MLMRRMLPMTVHVSLGRTMVEWYSYLDRWSLKNQTQVPEIEVCMQVRFSLPESVRLNVLNTSRSTEESA